MSDAIENSFWKKYIAGVNHSAGYDVHFWYSTASEKTNLFNLSHLKLHMALFECSDEFKTLNADEKEIYDKRIAALKTAEARLEKQYGKEAMDYVQLDLALALASHYAAGHTKVHDEPGLYEYSNMPLQFAKLKANEDVSGFHMMDNYADPKMAQYYIKFLEKLKKKDSKIPPPIHEALERTGFEPDKAIATLKQFEKEYAALNKRCQNPLTEQNVKFLIDTAPEEKKEQVQNFLEYLKHFPEKPTMRDNDRYWDLTWHHLNKDELFPYFLHNDKATAMEKVIYHGIQSNLTYNYNMGKTEKLPSIWERVRTFYKALPKDSFDSSRRINDVIDYFDIAFEKVAYPGKILAYEHHKMSRDELIHMTVDNFMAGKRTKSSRSTFDENDKVRFDQYFENKAAFERIKLPVYYGELDGVSDSDLDKAQLYLAEIREKAKQVVEKVKDRKSKWEREDNSQDNNEDEDDHAWYFREEKKLDLGDSWFDKLQEEVKYKSWDDGTEEKFHMHGGGIYNYIKALDTQLKQLDNIDAMLVSAYEHKGEQRNLKISSNLMSQPGGASAVTFDPSLTVKLGIVPRAIRLSDKAPIDKDALEGFQQYLNNRLPASKNYFSALKEPPLVKVNVVKNGLFISVQAISEEMISDNIKKLAKNNPNMIVEAQKTSGKGVVNALKIILKAKYPFIKDSDVQAGAGGGRPI